MSSFISGDTGFVGSKVTTTTLSAFDSTGLGFNTNNAERMRIDSSGNVGIGTTTPTATLDVIGSLRAQTLYTTRVDILCAQRTDTSGPTPYRIIQQGGGGRINHTWNVTGSNNPDAGVYAIGSEPALRFLINTNGFTFMTAPGGNAGDPITWTTGLFNNLNGNIGIGTTSPSYKFTVDDGKTAADSNFNTRFVSGNYWLSVNTRSTAGAWNPLVQADDASLIFSQGSVDTGGFVIGQHSNSSRGIRINSNGNVGIGQTSPAAKLHVGASGVGDIIAEGDITAYYSDERLKDITGTISNALKKINGLEGIYFKENRKAKEIGYSNDKQQVGVKAQSVQKVLPEAVTLAPFDTKLDEEGKQVSKSGENYLTVRYEKIVPLLIEGIKELTQIVNKQNETIEELKLALQNKL